MIITSRKKFQGKDPNITFLSTIGLVTQKFLKDHEVRLPSPDVLARVEDSIFFLFKDENGVKTLHLITKESQGSISLTDQHARIFILEYLIPALEQHLATYLSIRDELGVRASSIS